MGTFSETYDVLLGDGTIHNRQIKAAVAGDCYRRDFWSGNQDSYALPLNRGSFSLDLTETGLAFDASVEWISIGTEHGMADYNRSDQTASARCGGGCGHCMAASDFTPTPAWS